MCRGETYQRSSDIVGIASMSATTDGQLRRVWNRKFEVLSVDNDLEYLMVDGSIVRVHQHGSPKKNRIGIRNCG